MPSASVSVRLDFADPRQLADAVLGGLAEVLDAACRRAAGAIRARVGAVAAAAVRASPEYASLVAGDLRHQLGVADAAPVLGAVAAKLAGSVAVTPLGVRRAGDGLAGGLRLELLRADYDEVLSAGGSFRSEGGHQIDWLRWLTLEGDRLLVADHAYVAGPSRSSRTGYGVMARPGSWRVPPEYAGVAADNWLTRALLRTDDAVALAVAEELAGSV